MNYLFLALFATAAASGSSYKQSVDLTREIASDNSTISDISMTLILDDEIEVLSTYSYVNVWGKRIFPDRKRGSDCIYKSDAVSGDVTESGKFAHILFQNHKLYRDEDNCRRTRNPRIKRTIALDLKVKGDYPNPLEPTYISLKDVDNCISRKFFVYSNGHRVFNLKCSKN